MRSIIVTLFLALLMGVVVSQGRADEPAEEPTPPAELAQEGVERLLRALDAFIEMIPQYEMPMLNEDGDIIIRRKREDDPAPEKSEEDDQTST